MAKTALFTDSTDIIIPGVSGNIVELDNWDEPIAIGAEFKHIDDKLEVVCLMTDGTTWETIVDDNGPVILSLNRKQVTIGTPDTYALRGKVSNATTGYYIKL